MVQLIAPFEHAESGMTRFLPNVEQIHIERESVYMAYSAPQRNDTEIASYKERLRTSTDAFDGLRKCRVIQAGTGP